MKRFAELYRRLDSTTKTNEKIAAMVDYFQHAPAEDAAWATHFLSGKKLRRLVPTGLLRQWAAEEAGVPTWLFEESYQAVGDLAETLSLVVPGLNSDEDETLTEWINAKLLRLRKLEEPEQRQAVVDIWRRTDTQTRFVIMKLITGAFRVGVSKRLVTRALAEHAELSPDVIAHRLMGDWKPTADFFEGLISPGEGESLPSQPYPFCLAHAIEPSEGPSSLGNIHDYAAEWKWDGIRGQLIRRGGDTYLWSRGEELMEGRWPEIESAGEFLPDGTVLDGEILGFDEASGVLPFAQLQRRIGRKTVGKKLLTEVPVVFRAFDLLESDNEDRRALPFDERRRHLETLVETLDHPRLILNELVTAKSWEMLAEIRETSRDRNAEGLMLKRRDAPYDVGRVRGTWWKWKVAPFTIDAVLIYAQKGHGKRASLFTDYTFALWQDGELIPFAKAYSGLDDAEIRQVDRFVRKNTKESFGPVRSVTPQLVMELAFEGLQRSKRHKSGVATRFPRILRWRQDKQPEEANTLAELMELLPGE
ncbi:MAG: ATP-dependent DNA ligase [Planctomycetota bacterium]